MWGRKNRSETADQVAAETPKPVPTGERARGPWDATERDVEDDHLDFGALRIRLRPGMEIQVATDGETPLAILVASEGSAVELRPLAASRSGGDWASMRDAIVAEITERGSEPLEREGLFGTEIFTQFPATTEDGQDAVQPARFLGIEGPRWILRATILGPAGMEADDEGDLIDVIRDVIVVRSEEPRLLGESLPITVPEAQSPEEHDD